MESVSIRKSMMEFVNFDNFFAYISLMHYIETYFFVTMRIKRQSGIFYTNRWGLISERNFSTLSEFNSQMPVSFHKTKGVISLQK